MAVAAHHQPEEPIRSRLVSVPVPPPEGFTTADLPRLIEVVDGSFELEDGQVVIMAPATHWHDEVVYALKFALRAVAPRGFVIATEKGFNLVESAPEPDVLVVSREAVSAGSLMFVPSDVHLAVEVVSPNTKTKDRKLRAVAIRRSWYQMLLAGGERGRRNGRLHLRIASRGWSIHAQRCIPQTITSRSPVPDRR